MNIKGYNHVMQVLHRRVIQSEMACSDTKRQLDQEKRQVEDLRSKCKLVYRLLHRNSIKTCMLYIVFLWTDSKLCLRIVQWKPHLHSFTLWRMSFRAWLRPSVSRETRRKQWKRSGIPLLPHGVVLVTVVFPIGFGEGENVFYSEWKIIEH